MKATIFLIGILMSNIVFGQNANSFYSLKAKTLDGKTFDFSTLKGKKVLIVNTASKCGFTPQYKDLETLHKQYGDKVFIMGFPSNDFMGQEPLNDEEIADFCERNYGVTFLMMSKISVKGRNMHPVYQWLTQKSKNGVIDSKVKWNFQKYLINENGTLYAVLDPSEKPMSDKIINWILGKQ